MAKSVLLDSFLPLIGRAQILATLSPLGLWDFQSATLLYLSEVPAIVWHTIRKLSSTSPHNPKEAIWPWYLVQLSSGLGFCFSCSMVLTFISCSLVLILSYIRLCSCPRFVLGVIQPNRSPISNYNNFWFLSFAKISLVTRLYLSKL